MKRSIVEVKINSRYIGEKHSTFIVAEIGINHGGSLDFGKKLITAAKQAGADAVKFQTYITEKRVSKTNPFYKLLKKCELTADAFKILFKHAKQKNITFISTAFDEESADLLVDLEVPAIKIASFDIVNLKLLRYISKKRKPMIISRGMARLGEVKKALSILNQYKTPVVLLHCVSSYPTPIHRASLACIHTLKNHLRCPIGYSDHTLGINAAVMAVTAGAKMIEKHFTIDKTIKEPDHAISADPSDMKEMIKQIREVEKILGNGIITLQKVEKDCLNLRRPS